MGDRRWDGPIVVRFEKCIDDDGIEYDADALIDQLGDVAREFGLRPKQWRGTCPRTLPVWR